MTTVFDPSVWKKQGQVLQDAAKDFYDAATPAVVTSGATPSGAQSPIDRALNDGHAAIHDPWHHVIAGAYEATHVLASKMVGTGDDYAATEADAKAASDRFWQHI